ncbi:unnamed protein product [Effrenium voratum]|nr:unnamed protein product [Effrenium voratum]
MLFILPTLLTLANSARVGSVSETGANLCNEWLLVSYDDGQESNRKYGTFRYKSWPLESNRVMVMKESSKDGCVKKYTADCENGGFIQEVACPGQEPTNTSKCLGGLTCSVSSRKTDISAEEKASVYVPKKGWIKLTSGKVVFKAVDPAKGRDLAPPPGNHNWHTEAGCYCCQTDYGLGENPFSMSSGRAAWASKGNGLQECMLAWRMIGNGLSASCNENADESHFWDFPFPFHFLEPVYLWGSFERRPPAS